MIGKFLGISAGIALGTALLAAPASASLFIDDGLGGTIDVGDVDRFIGSCSVNDSTLTGTGLAKELDCLNREIGHDTGTDGAFTNTDALKIEILDFQLVNDTLNTYAQELTDEFDVSREGGWFSIKTGNNVTCAVVDQNILDITHCEDGGLFLIFENLSSMLYAVVDLGILLDPWGIDMNNDIMRFSHITVVPLPGAALLFGSALLGGGLMRRRKVIKKLGLPS